MNDNKWSNPHSIPIQSIGTKFKIIMGKWTRRTFIGLGGLAGMGLIVGVGGYAYMGKQARRFTGKGLCWVNCSVLLINNIVTIVAS